MVPHIARIRPFSSRWWIFGSAALGFACGALLAVLVWVVLMIALTPGTGSWFRHEIALFVGIALVSLPALGQRWLLARSGIASGGYFTTTMLGGWLTWCVPILAFGRVDLIARLQRIDEIDIGIVLGGAALLLGGLIAGWLQGWSMPHPLRPLWFRTAPLAALVGAFGAAAVALLFALATWQMPWVVRDPILGGLAVATGWGLFALVMDWPIRHALSLMQPDTVAVAEPAVVAVSAHVVVEPVAVAETTVESDPVPGVAAEPAAG